MTRIYLYSIFPSSSTEVYIYNTSSPGYADVYQVDGSTGNIQLDPQISPINPEFTLNYTGYANGIGGIYTSNYANNPNSTFFISATSGFQSSQTLTLEQTPGSGLPSILNCYLPGTLIATADGETAVEAIRPGDLVRTASGALRPVRWVGAGRIRQTWLESLNPQHVPIRIHAGALGMDAAGSPIPRRDLMVTHNHGMVLDGVLIPAAWLRNGSSILSELGMTAWDYFHVELDTHDILLAEGAESESYRQCANRFVFDNAGSACRGEEDVEEPSCLPIVLEGPVLERALQRIVARDLQARPAAQPLKLGPAGPSLTDHPEALASPARTDDVSA